MSHKTVFISYRRDPAGQGPLLAQLLHSALTLRGYDVFLDVRSLDAGTWEAQIRAEVPTRSHFLLLLTAGALDRCADPHDWLRREFELARASARNIVPVWNESVQLDALRNTAPEAMADVFAFQATPIRHDSLQEDIERLLQRFIAPHTALARVESRQTSCSADISRIDRYAPADLIGREPELALLDEAWDKARRGVAPRPHVITFVALGGEGKTSIVAKWAATLAANDWPGCDEAFAWSFYSQGTREQMTGSSDLFLNEALTFFGDATLAASAQTAYDKGRRLAQLAGERRALLILDGLEPLQYAPTSPQPGMLKDQGVSALLKGLAASNRGLCVVTTRYSISDLKNYRQTTAPEIDLVSLSVPAGVALLKKLGVRGGQPEFESLVRDVKGHALTLNLLGAYLRDAHGGDVRKRGLVKLQDADAEEQGGHAFRVIDAYIHWMVPHRGRAQWRTGFSKSSRETSLEGKRQLATLQLLGLFDRPATVDCVDALRRPPPIPDLTESLVGVADAQWNLALSRLEGAKLLTVNREASGRLVSLDAHPLVREYFARHLKTKRLRAWRSGHRRVFEHLSESTEDKPQPTFEDLQPLYQAIPHGCQAGLEQAACREVYFGRILRGKEFYSTHKLGSIGADLAALACFFEQPWSVVLPSLQQDFNAWLMNEVGFSLRALGRLREALEPLRRSSVIDAEAGRWVGAAISRGSLSQLELAIGEIPQAIQDAKQMVADADAAGDDHDFQRVISRAVLADAEHQAGNQSGALAHFQQAEAAQVELYPELPWLASLQGFFFCDLLLAPAERAAWATSLATTGRESVASVAAPDVESLFAACRAVSQRATQALAVSNSQNWLLDIALDQLTLARAELCGAILNNADFHIESAADTVDSAVVGLRRAGTQHHLPRSLLTRARVRSLTAALTGPDSAQTDLDEAWEIAERGPMRLFMADVHLYRARLFHAITPYPWSTDPDGRPRGPKDDLAAARKLIEQCGYWRRKEELEDAEEAANGWSA